MDQHKALEILSALADGINPITGEIFSKDSPYHHPEIARALYCAVNLLQPDVQKKPKVLPERAGKPWDQNEDNQLISAFDSGMSIVEIANKHQRTRGSIASRLVRLGKIEERNDVYNRRKDEPISL